MIRPSSIVDPAGQPGGDVLVVGDHDDRRAVGVELVEQGQDGRRRWRSRGCRSARRPARSRAGPTSARAIATRCRSPPDSWVGRVASSVRQPDPLQRRRGAGGAARPRATPGVQQPVGDVVERGLRARRGRTAGTRSRSGAPAAPASRRSGSRRRRGRRPAPCREVGRSRVPIRCSSVVLPDPDGPTTATSSPRRTARLTPRSGVHRRRAGIGLGHAREFEHWAGTVARAVRRGGVAARPGRARAAPRSWHAHVADHDAVAHGQAVAGDLNQPGRRRRTVPGRHRDQVVQAVGGRSRSTA